MTALRAWAQVAAGVLLLFPIQATIDGGRGEPPDMIQTLPPQPILPALAFGHGEAAADLLEIQATNFLIHKLAKFDRMDRDQLWRLYGAITELDPNSVGAYQRGALYLASVADSPDEAVDLLKRGLGRPYGEPEEVARRPVHPQHQERWKLYHEWAATYFLQHRARAQTAAEQDAFVREAGLLWLEASGQPGAPPWLEAVGRRMSTKGISRLQALELECRMWEERTQEGDRIRRERAAQRLLEARSALARQALQEEVDRRTQAGAPVSDLAQLSLSPEDPLGCGFILRDGRVVAPALEARSLERFLLPKLRSWAEENPGRVPTLADLYVALPDYLQLTELSRESVRLAPRLR